MLVPLTFVGVGQRMVDEFLHKVRENPCNIPTHPGMLGGLMSGAAAGRWGEIGSLTAYNWIAG